MIEIQNLVKKYSSQTVLDIGFLKIPAGQTFGLIGNNGAGKTTLFSCLLDLIKPTKGKVINNQVDVSISEDWKSFTTAFLDETFLIGYLMPEEYFYFIGELRGLSKQKVDSFMSQFEDFFNGEILGENGQWFHAQNNTASENPAMLVWYSESFKINNPEIVKNLLNNQYKKFSTDFLFHSILDISNIKGFEINKRQSIFSKF